MSDQEIYQNSIKKRPQKNYRGGFGDYCCIPACQIAFYDANRVKTGIALFKLPKDPALRKKWLQVIKRYRRTGGADKFSKTKKVMVSEFHFNPKQIRVSLKLNLNPLIRNALLTRQILSLISQKTQTTQVNSLLKMKA